MQRFAALTCIAIGLTVCSQATIAQTDTKPEQPSRTSSRTNKTTLDDAGIEPRASTAMTYKAGDSRRYVMMATSDTTNGYEESSGISGQDPLTTIEFDAEIVSVEENGTLIFTLTPRSASVRTWDAQKQSHSFRMLKVNQVRFAWSPQSGVDDSFGRVENGHTEAQSLLLGFAKTLSFLPSEDIGQGATWTTEGNRIDADGTNSREWTEQSIVIDVEKGVRTIHRTMVWQRCTTKAEIEAQSRGTADAEAAKHIEAFVMSSTMEDVVRLPVGSIFPKYARTASSSLAAVRLNVREQFPTKHLTRSVATFAAQEVPEPREQTPTKSDLVPRK